MQSKKITKYLLSIYILFLIWIILFKMSLPFQNLSHIRSINLIPFAAPAVTNGTINLDEIIANFIAFLPFGIFTGILLETKSVLAKTAPIFLTSLLLETAQFMFAIGASDITDLLMNTLGGMSGIICLLGASVLFLLIGTLLAVNLSH